MVQHVYSVSQIFFTFFFIFLNSLYIHYRGRQKQVYSYEYRKQFVLVLFIYLFIILCIIAYFCTPLHNNFSESMTLNYLLYNCVKLSSITSVISPLENSNSYDRVCTHHLSRAGGFLFISTDPQTSPVRHYLH